MCPWSRFAALVAGSVGKIASAGPGLARPLGASSGGFPPAPFRLAARWLAHRALELQPVWIGEEHRIVALAILWIVGRRIDPRDLVPFQQGVEIIDVLALAELESIMVEADIAETVRMLLASASASPIHNSVLALLQPTASAKWYLGLKPRKPRPGRKSAASARCP